MSAGALRAAGTWTDQRPGQQEGQQAGALYFNWAQKRLNLQRNVKVAFSAFLGFESL